MPRPWPPSLPRKKFGSDVSSSQRHRPENRSSGGRGSRPGRVFKSSRWTTASGRSGSKAKEDGNTIAAAGAWISDKKFRYALGVAARTKSAILAGRIAYLTSYREALARQAEWQNTLDRDLQESGLHRSADAANAAAADPAEFKDRLAWKRVMLALQNTVAVNFAGNPALAVPIPLHDDRRPRDEPATDRTAPERGAASQRGPVGGSRGQKMNGENIAAIRPQRAVPDLR